MSKSNKRYEEGNVIKLITMLEQNQILAEIEKVK